MEKLVVFDVRKGGRVGVNDGPLTTRKIVEYSWLVLLFSVSYQLFFFSSFANLYSLICVVLGWSIITKVLFNTSSFQNHPFSSFLILGFSLTQIYFPLIFTSLEGKSLVQNLEVPEEVFTHTFLSLTVLLIAHQLYKGSVRMQGSSRKGIRKILHRNHLFTPLTSSQIWCMGFLGLFAMVYTHFFSSSSDVENSNGIAGSFIRGFISFAYAPFFLPFSKLFRNVNIKSKRITTHLIFYGIVLLGVSMGANSRGTFMLSFTAIGFSYLLGLLLNIFKVPRLSANTILFGIISVWLFIGPIQDIGTAMALVRGQRNDISRVQLIGSTLNAYKDKAAINDYRKSAETTESDWDESYLSNIFLARFCNLKFNDLSLVQSNRIGSNDSKMFEFSINRLLSAIPSPILKVAGIDIDKEEVISASIGDVLYYTSTGDHFVLGGFRTGHFSGTGMAAFGWWYLGLLGFLIIPVFFLVDSFVLVESSSQFPKHTFSLCGLLSITTIFQFLPCESVVNIGVFIVRGWIQIIVLYIILYHSTKFALSLFRKA